MQCRLSMITYARLCCISIFGFILISKVVSDVSIPFRAPKSQQPNFVVLFADDIGWGDLGANWKPNKNVTPNLNGLAQEGLRLTDFHAGASVCTPSRAALLTGRLGVRTGVIRNFETRSVAGLPLNETTIAEVLQKNGYNTGMIGKWHLGITEKYHPKSRGFDYYYGLPWSDDMGCVDAPGYNLPPEDPCPTKPISKTPDASLVSVDSLKPVSALPLYEDYGIVEQPADLFTLGDHYGNKTVEFLKKVKDSDKPFFLYVAFAHMHVPLAHADRFTNSTSLKTVYSDTLRELDDVIGRITGTLKSLGLYDNTVTWFTGDNGPWDVKCQYSGSPGPFLASWQRQKYGGATSKMTTWEAGHREPTVVVWPGHIEANQVSDALTSALDVFPTLLSLAGIDFPPNRHYDGMDLSRFFMGKMKSAHSALFHPNSGDTLPAGEIDAVRMGPYKVYWRTGGHSAACDKSIAPLQNHDPPMVFDVVKDPAESSPLTQERFPNLQNVIAQATQLRENLFANIKADNTTVADYSISSDALPCCNPNVFLCRCKKD